MLKKPLVFAAIAATVVTATLSPQASANGDPLLGALVGGSIGAAIGHGVNGRNGAWVGGALGAVTGRKHRGKLRRLCRPWLLWSAKHLLPARTGLL